jgi:ABC-type multidrug transport system ATPase subunit
MMCDRVTILQLGRVVVSGELGHLLKREVRRIDIVLSGAGQDFARSLAQAGHEVREVGNRLVIEVQGVTEVDPLLERALKAGASVLEVIPRHETLEELFLRQAIVSPDLAKSG